MTSDDGNISSDFSQTKMGFFRPCGGCGNCANCTSGKHIVRRSVELDSKLQKLNSHRQTMNLKRSVGKKSGGKKSVGKKSSVTKYKSDDKKKKSTS
mmetsp:Transcript_4607/g.7018  ORF Transcript_4607/g.7018 Transcript_4607/m.7018 type:complete len:96 (+) Transcript_4607:1138-1425(+)